MDGAEFMSTKKESFDVIITDSSDPIGKFSSGPIIQFIVLNSGYTV